MYTYLVASLLFLMNEANFMIDGTLIRELRNAKGLTQAELGALIGTEGNLVSRWERGYSTPSHYYMLKLSEVLEKPVEYFTKGQKHEIQESSITMNKGMLVFELGSQRLEVPATSEFSQQFWERVDRMIEKSSPNN